MRKKSILSEPGNECNLAPLAVGAREAARMVGIGERLLWAKTNTGEIPHVRIGRRVLYPVDGLREWLARESKHRAKP